MRYLFVLLLAGCSWELRSRLSLGQGSYTQLIDQGQSELAKEKLHNAELRAALSGYAK